MIARIEVLTKQLIRRYGDILDTALDPTTENANSSAPTIVDTANRQLIVDTSTAALIRAAEELMVLTRTMKELWLFGGLDTLQKDESVEEKEQRRKIEEDEQIVVRGMREWCRNEAGKIVHGEKEEVQVQDVEMDEDDNDSD